MATWSLEVISAGSLAIGYIDNTFLVMKANCNIFGWTVRLMRKLTYQNECCCFFYCERC